MAEVQKTWINGVSNNLVFGGVIGIIALLIAAYAAVSILGGDSSSAPAGDSSIEEVATTAEAAKTIENNASEAESLVKTLPVTVSEVSDSDDRKVISTDSVVNADSSLVEVLKNQAEMDGGNFMDEWTLSGSIETDASKIVPLNPGQTDELASLAADSTTDSQAANAVWNQIGGQFTGDNVPSVFYYKVDKTDVKAKSIAEQSKSRVITAELKPNLKIGEVDFEYYEILAGGNKVTVDKDDIKDLGKGTFYGADYSLDE